MKDTKRKIIYAYYTLTHFNVPYVTENEKLCVYQHCKYSLLRDADSKSIIVGIGATKTEARGNIVYVMEVKKAMTFEDLMGSRYVEFLSCEDKKYLNKTHSSRYPFVLLSPKPHYFYFGGYGKSLDGELERFRSKFKIRGRKSGQRLMGKYNYLTLGEEDAKAFWTALTDMTSPGMYGERPDEWYIGGKNSTNIQKSNSRRSCYEGDSKQEGI